MLLEYIVPLAAMLVLAVFSAFFSASEAALFSLRPRERREFAAGNRGQRMAASLLDQPERLLGGVLFWNLCVNTAYYELASVLSIHLKDSAGTLFAVGALIALVICGELVPKSLAVIRPRTAAALVSIPLAAVLKLLDGLMPAMQAINTFSLRLIWPGFKPEPYLDLSDLERAAELTSDNEVLRARERKVLQNIVALADLRVDEAMRPRRQLRIFRPPVALADLGGRLPESGYVLITEPDNDEIVSAVPVREMSNIPNENLERFAEDVVYVPWSTPVARVLDQLRQRDRDVAVVLNEYGETIGVITYDDILHAIFSDQPRATRSWRQPSIQQVEEGVWRVTGITSLRRMSRYFHRPLEAEQSVTLAGAIQEVLQRVPERGDSGVFSGFRFEIIELTDDGQMLIELRPEPTAEEES